MINNYQFLMWCMGWILQKQCYLLKESKHWDHKLLHILGNVYWWGYGFIYSKYKSCNATRCEYVLAVLIKVCGNVRIFHRQWQNVWSLPPCLWRGTGNTSLVMNINLFKAYWLLSLPQGLTSKNFCRWLHCIYVFCMALRTNSNFFLIHH